MRTFNCGHGMIAMSGPRKSKKEVTAVLTEGRRERGAAGEVIPPRATSRGI